MTLPTACLAVSLDGEGQPGQVPPLMSAEADAPRKHRHDLGQEDHGPVMAAGTTRAIQIILGMWIAGTVFVTMYTLVTASRPVTNGRPAPTLPGAAH